MDDAIHCDSELWEYMWDHDDEPLRARDRARAAVASEETEASSAGRASRRCARRWDGARVSRELAYFWNRYWPGRALGYQVESVFFKSGVDAVAACYPAAKQISVDVT